jgi:hypothetical protein
VQRLESIKTNLKEVHERLDKRTQQTTPLIESNRRLGRSFTAFGEFLASVREDPELGTRTIFIYLLFIHSFIK